MSINVPSLFGCQCKPKVHTHWYVVHYRCNYSAFNGYHRTSSDYSAIACSKCGAHWRTKAAYVNKLPHLPTPTAEAI